MADHGSFWEEGDGERKGGKERRWPCLFGLGLKETGMFIRGSQLHGFHKRASHPCLAIAVVSDSRINTEDQSHGECV